MGLPRTSKVQSVHAGRCPIIPVRASPPRPPQLSCVLYLCTRHIWSVLSWMNVFFFYEWNSLITDERERPTGRDRQSSPPHPLINYRPITDKKGDSCSWRYMHREEEPARWTSHTFGSDQLFAYCSHSEMKGYLKISQYVYIYKYKSIYSSGKN